MVIVLFVSKYPPPPCFILCTVKDKTECKKRKLLIKVINQFVPDLAIKLNAEGHRIIPLLYELNVYGNRTD